MKVSELVKVTPINTHPLEECFQEKIPLVVRDIDFPGHFQGRGFSVMKKLLEIVGTNIILVCTSGKLWGMKLSLSARE